MRERSLVAFTLLIQTAVGMWWIASVLFLSVHRPVADKLLAPVLAACVPITAAAILASFFHLGTPTNAWRVLSNARSSWLSREILSTLVFGVSSLLTGVAVWFGLGPAELQAALVLVTTLAGLILIVSMSNAYRLRTVEVWKTWFTPASFFVTAGLLGLLLTGALLIVTLDNLPQGQLFVWMTRYDFSPQGIFHLMAAGVLGLLIARWALMRGWLKAMAGETAVDLKAAESFSRQRQSIVRLYNRLLIVGLIAAALLVLVDERTSIILLTLAACVSVTCAEITGRWLFYAARTGARVGL
jgi:DMSO reductase anchor subunit